MEKKTKTTYFNHDEKENHLYSLFFVCLFTKALRTGFDPRNPHTEVNASHR